MMIFLTIAKNKVAEIEQIFSDTNLDIEDAGIPLKKLEEGDFIIKNPNPLSNKYKLGFNGQLFVEQLKIMYPEIKKELGEESSIEPLKS